MKLKLLIWILISATLFSFLIPEDRTKKITDKYWAMSRFAQGAYAYGDTFILEKKTDWTKCFKSPYKAAIILHSNEMYTEYFHNIDLGIINNEGKWKIIKDTLFLFAADTIRTKIQIIKVTKNEFYGKMFW